VQVPVLAVYGAADEVVPARASAKAVERALRRGRNGDITVKVLPAANHALRTLPLVAGGPWDWPRAAPGFVDMVTDWMLAHAAEAAPPPSR
jgi:dienelactone hydrolase